jgi:hypothetical protein
MMTETTYQYWRHRESGAIFAVRMERGEVTGFYGPIVADDLHPGDLPLYPYDGSKEALEWLWEHAADCFRVE